MHGVALALVLVLGLPPAPSADPLALVGQLASPRFAERETADQALTRLGRAALPALKAGSAHKDLEIRHRASAILRRIEATLLVQPTTIALDFDQIPFAEAVRTINRRTGLALEATPERETTWADRPLTLATLEPVPFWKAMDALCLAADAHYVFGGQPTLGPGDSTFPLYEGYAPPPEPVADSGPFRVQLTSLHYQSEIRLDRPRPPAVGRGRAGGPAPTESPGSRPEATQQFYLQLLVAAEPRLAITQNGPVRLTEASDDQGRSLLLPPDRASIQHAGGYFGVSPSALVRLRVDLARADHSVRRIGRLRGVVPVIVTTRRPESLDIPLAGAISRVFHADPVAVIVRAHRPARDGQPATIELSLRSSNGANLGPIDAQEGDAPAYRPESPQQQIELLDARGKPLPWFPSGTYYANDETRLTLTLLQHQESAEPITLRYHGLIRGTAEIPFEFRDLPMP